MNRHPPARLLLVAALAFVIGWLASAAWLGLAPLRYVGILEGTVALVNEDGTQVCVEPNSGVEQRCGVLAGPRDTVVVPVVGQRVTIVVGWLRTSDSLEQEIFVIAPPQRGG